MRTPPSGRARPRRWSPTLVRVVCALLVSLVVSAVSAEGASAAAWKISSPGGGLVGGMDSVSCVSSTWCMAVGSELGSPGYGSIGQPSYAPGAFSFVWDGHSWTPETVPLPSANSSGYLAAVSCTAANFCLAVGATTTVDPSTLLVEQWNGSVWTQISDVPPGEQLSGVSCVSTTFCMAVGPDSFGAATAVQWNGSGLISEPAARNGPDNLGDLSAVSCLTASDCTAVGEYVIRGDDDPRGTMAQHWNGTQWTVRGTVGPVNFGTWTSVSCPSPTFCVAVGTKEDDQGAPGIPISGTWNGRSWVNQPSVRVGNSGGALLGVSCIASSDCIAVGDRAVGQKASYDEPKRWELIVQRYNGRRWILQSVPQVTTGEPLSPLGNAYGLRGVSCSDALDCVAVGARASGAGFAETR